MFRSRMEATTTYLPIPFSSESRLSRRTLFRVAGAGVILGFAAEAGRVLFGSNEHTVIPGKVYRTAQLSREQLERFITRNGIKTVINLRGCCPNMDWYQGDALATHATGISQEDLTFSAKRYPPATEVARLVEVFDRTEYPVVLHCARGADRTGLASTIAVLLLTDADPAVARRHMRPRYGHVAAVGRTGLLDEFFDAYEAHLETIGQPHTPDCFRRWATDEYCPGPFRAALSIVEPTSLEVPAGKGFQVVIRARNIAVQPWRFTTGGSGGVRLAYSLHAMSGERVYKGQAGLLARTVQPGESIDLVAGFPPLRPGRHMLNADLLDAQPIDLLDTAFGQYGSEPLFVGLTVV
jgi:protein tyrosine phosphatase (PTP) superfamily phosphohydrolase (DUF442 family)